MLESGKNEVIIKKSYEIAYALWRIAAKMGEKTFAGKLFDKAIDLISFAADGNQKDLFAALRSLETVVRFAVDVNMISGSNAGILVREIGNLKSELSLPESLPEKGVSGNDVDISDIFAGNSGNNYSDEFAGIEKESSTESLESVEREEERESGNDNGESGKNAAIRQSAIFEKIRQIGNCQLSEIQEILPGLSERTIRYDLEALVQRNLIERIGSGGRGVYYRVTMR